MIINFRPLRLVLVVALVGFDVVELAMRAIVASRKNGAPMCADERSSCGDYRPAALGARLLLGTGLAVLALSTHPILSLV